MAPMLDFEDVVSEKFWHLGACLVKMFNMEFVKSIIL